MLGWSGSGGEWTGADKTGHRHPPQRASAWAWASGPCVPSLENRGPPFCLYRRRAAVRQRDRRHGHSMDHCSHSQAPLLLMLLLGHSSHSQAPHRRCLPLKKKATAEPMCGTAMSERDDWCSSSSYRPGRSGGRPSALRTGRPDIRTARRLFRRFPTSHSQPLFTRESLPRAVISAYATRASIDHWNVRLGATGAQTLCVWTGTPSLVGA